MISIIAAIGKNNELGKNGDLIFRIKEDMKFFKATTMGHGVLMGRKTFDSISRPLPGRTNYVVTRRPDLLPDGIEPVRNLRQFLTSWQDSDDEIFVIGGGTIYEAALPFAKCLYLTEIDSTASDADTFFPEFDKSQYTKTIIKKGSEDDLTYTFVEYNKI